LVGSGTARRCVFLLRPPGGSLPPCAHPFPGLRVPLPKVAGCNQNTCQFNPGWACRQPGANNSGLADVPGPIRIPGPDGLLPATQGWGEVPYGFNITCWCTAPLGSYASADTNCFATPCPFPARCVLQNPSLPGNGTTCVIGSQGVGCSTCSKQWYRYLDGCRPCPKVHFDRAHPGPPARLALTLSRLFRSPPRASTRLSSSWVSSCASASSTSAPSWRS
jgi:hypothetical protein